MKTPAAAVLALSLALTAVQPVAFADAPSSPRIEAQAVAGSSIKRIRASIVVDAPLARVRDVMFDYGHYPEFMPLYEKASVLWTTPAGDRLVHMQLGGIVKLWMRVQISPAHATPSGGETYDGKLVQGNIKAFEPRWELEPLGADKTRVTVESFMDPDLPLVPSGLINSGAKDGVRDAIVALRNRIEGRPSTK